MVDYDTEKIPGSIAMSNATWERLDVEARSGFFQWVRPLHHDERDWNRHEIDVVGQADFPVVIVELRHENGIWHVVASRTSGPDETRSGMGGVYERTQFESLDVAVEKVRNCMKEYPL